MKENARAHAFAVIVIGAVGELTLYIGPLLLGAAIDSFAFTLGDAGYLVSCEFGLSAVTSLYISSRKRLNNSKSIALFSIALLIFCNWASFVTNSATLFVLCRLYAALGAGALFAIGNTAAAGQKDPQRIFAMMIMVAVLLSSFVYAAAPTSIAILGPRGPLCLLLIVALAACPFILGLSDGEPRAILAKKLPFRIVSPSLLTLTAIFMLYVSQSGLWAYVERIGQTLGLSIESISFILAINGFIAIGAGLLAGALGTRLGVFIPITVAFAVQIVVAFLLPRTSTVEMYGINAITFTFALVFVVPYLKALLSKLDPTGRSAGLATAFITLGSATGPAVMGFALNGGADFRSLSALACLGLTLAWALAMLVSRHPQLSARANPTPSQQD
ncbi:MAG: MFS transporter [Pseudomonadota bacterium]